MYRTDDSLPVDELDPGTFLLSGPAMSGKYDLLLDVVAEGFPYDEAGLFVSTNQGSAEVFDDLEERAAAVPDRFRVVDCVSEQQGSEADLGDRVEYVSSPADLTGIGIGVSEQLRRLAESGAPRTRVGFYSVSTLLMYAELETVFRFLHVLTGRVDSIDGLGLFAVDPTTHDESTINTLKQLFDGMIELREDGGDREVRVVGVPDSSAEWVTLA